jgi:hypothetical protein
MFIITALAAYQPALHASTPTFTRRSSAPLLVEVNPRRGASLLGFAGGAFTGNLLWAELLANNVVDRKPLKELAGENGLIDPNFDVGAALKSIQLPDTSSLQLPESFKSFKLPDASSFQMPEALKLLKLPDASSFQMPEALKSLKLPDASSFKLPEGLDSLGGSLKDFAAQVSDQAATQLLPPAGAAEPLADATAAASEFAALLQQQTQSALSGVKLPTLDSSTLETARAALLDQAAALSSQVPPPEELATYASAQLEATATATATEAANFVGALTGDVLVPLATGLLGAALFGGLSGADNVLGLLLRVLGLAADLVFQLVVGITLPVLLAILNIVFGALVGAIFGAVVGPGTLVSSLADTTRRDLAKNLADALAAPGKALVRVGELPGEIGRTLFLQDVKKGEVPTDAPATAQVAASPYESDKDYS